MLTPIVTEVLVANPSNVTNLDEYCDGIAEGDNIKSFVSDLNEKAQLEYEQRLNDVFNDIIKLGQVN